MCCVCSEDSPHCFSSTVVIRTYVYFVGYTQLVPRLSGKTVLNLRSRNTKKAQMMGETQQQHSTAAAVKLQQ